MDSNNDNEIMVTAIKSGNRVTGKAYSWPIWDKDKFFVMVAFKSGEIVSYIEDLDDAAA
jgi:hypothetical protein